MNKYFVLIGSLLVLVALFGCIDKDTILPYTNSQFFAQSTDLNYTAFLAGDYNNLFLMFDGNKISTYDLNFADENIPWSSLINFPVGCGANQVVKIVGSSLVCVDLPIDTNLYTAGILNDSNFVLINLDPATTLSQSLGTGANRWLNLFVQTVNAELIDTFDVVASGDVNASRFFGDGSGLTGLSPDTNAQTACPDDQVLYGDGTCGVPINGLSSFYFPTDKESDIANYEVLQDYPDDASNSDTATISSGTGQVLIDAYLTDINSPYVSVIPAGLYSFFVYAGIDSDSGDTYIDVNVFKRDLAGTETSFFGVTTPVINGSDSTLYRVDYTLLDDYAVNLTDRFLVKFYGRNNHATNKTLTLYYGGASAYTYIRTTLPAGGSTGYVKYAGNNDNLNMSDFNVIANTFFGEWVGNVIGVLFGGTGMSSYSTGDIIYSNATNSLAALPIGDDNQVLRVSLAGAPEWTDFYNCPWLDGNAIVSQVAQGQTFFSNGTTKLTGTLDVTVRYISNTSPSFLAGYYDANDLNVIDTNLIPANILDTATIFGITGTASGGAELHSGQITVYDSDGDDATNDGTAKSYTDNSDGTVTDNQTGLMWAKDHHSNCTTVTWATAIDTCEALTTGSHSDWRLPSVVELITLADYNYPSSSYLNSVFTQTGWGSTCTGYWSSTTIPSLSSFAYYLYSTSGYIYNDNKTSGIPSYGARCVRG